MALGIGTQKRWGRALLVVGLVGLLTTLRPASAPAADAPGIGRAHAVLMRLDPRQAGLSFGVQIGPSQADHRNTVARATTQSTDYGLVGSSMTSPACDGGDPPFKPEDLPQEQRSDSRDKGAGTEETREEGPVTQSTVASSKPFARSTSRLADVGVPGVFVVRGVSDDVSSGLGPDGHRFAIAKAHVGELQMAGGAVVLGSMDWVATNRGGSKPRGSFSIGSASIGGVPMSTDDPGAVFDAVNVALAPLGLALTSPKVSIVENTVYVTPLTFSVVPNETRDLVAKTTLGAAQPVREAIFNPFIEQDCNNASYVLVLDLMIGPFTGAGEFDTSLAGVWAETGVPDEFQFGSVPPLPAPAAAASPAPEYPPLAEVPAAEVPDVDMPAVESDDVAPPVEQAAPISTGSPASDRAAAVALASLLLGAGLLEGDRRKMRRAERAAAQAGELTG